MGAEKGKYSIVGIREFPNFNTQTIQKMHWSAKMWGTIVAAAQKHFQGEDVAPENVVLNDNGGGRTQDVVSEGLFQQSAFDYSIKGNVAKAGQLLTKKDWIAFFKTEDEGIKRIAAYEALRDSGKKIVQLATGPFRSQETDQAVYGQAVYGLDKGRLVCSLLKNCNGGMGKKVPIDDPKVEAHKNCTGTLKPPSRVWKDGDGEEFRPHTAYWDALKATILDVEEFICRPRLAGATADGILPQSMELGNNDMIAEQCQEYFAQYMIQENMKDFASGKAISCVVKLCDMGSTTLQETTILYTVRNRTPLPANAEEKENNYRTPEMLFESGQQTVFSFKLFARKCNSSNTPKNRKQSDYWIVDAENNTIMKHQTSSKATISGSCKIVESHKTDDTQIKVFFENMSSKRTFKNRYFKRDQNTIEFLKLLKAIGESDKYQQDYTIKHNFDLDPADLQPVQASSERRRRMAQREFSSRRDSPVMVRLLQQIVRANQKHNELN